MKIEQAMWLDDGQKELLEDGHVFTKGEDTYYFLPFVFKKNKNGHYRIVFIQDDFPKEFKK